MNMAGLNRGMVVTMSDADIPFMASVPSSSGGTLPRPMSTGAVTSLRDMHELRTGLPRQLKYSFWQR